MLMSTIQFNVANIPGQACCAETAEIFDFDMESTNGYLTHQLFGSKENTLLESLQTQNNLILDFLDKLIIRIRAIIQKLENGGKVL